jgi:DNA-directed RNA polymerase specialized sigma24 family protein
MVAVSEGQSLCAGASPHQLPLEVLLHEAQQESRCRGKWSSAQVATVEVLRRALLLRDEEAWAGLYRLYAPVVQAWIRRSAAGQVLAADADAVEELVNDTFAKFATALSRERWQQFPTANHVLAYLKRCATSVVADAGRQQQRRTREVSLETLETLDYEQVAVLDDPAEVVSQHLVCHDLWRVANEVAHSEQARLLLQHFAQGVPLRELARRYPDLFPTTQSVHWCKKNLLRRLRRSRAVQQAAGLVTPPARGQPLSQREGQRPVSQPGRTP